MSAKRIFLEVTNDLSGQITKCSAIFSLFHKKNLNWILALRKTETKTEISSNLRNRLKSIIYQGRRNVQKFG